METNCNIREEEGLGRQLSGKVICVEMFDNIKYPINTQS